jgi:hypothetical protein
MIVPLKETTRSRRLWQLRIADCGLRISTVRSIPNPQSAIQNRRCAGSIYLHVLASSLLITILGLGALAAVRIQMRSARLVRDAAEARACAVSAIELGLLQIKQNPNWRTERPNGTWFDNQALGAGRFTLQAADLEDGSLSDSVYEPVVLTGIGTKGTARHKAQVTLVPVVKPLAALSSCVVASGNIVVSAGKQIAVIGAPVTTNANLGNSGTIDGNAEGQTANPPGAISGTLIVPGTVKPMPEASVFGRYVGKATAVPYAATIEKVVLAPGCNPLGPSDPNGLYVINTGGSNITLRNCRICGTLIILAGNHSVILDNAMFMQTYRPDFPVLLVEGNVSIRLKSVAGPLSEATCSTNFNPAGAPYGGVTDTDKTDQYPNEIRGLIHVKGTLELRETTRMIGVAICEGTLNCQATSTVVYDAGLYASPPQGYTCVEGMKISPGSWRQVVD